MDYYVGLDVSLRSVAVCMIDADGKHVFERSVGCEIDDISRCLADFPASELRIGFESGAMSQHLFFGLQEAGFSVVCMEARQVNAALSAMRNKTDKTDARGIANVLRSGWFNPVHVKSRGECPVFCVTWIWSMLPERSKDDDNFQGTAGRVAEGLRAA